MEVLSAIRADIKNELDASEGFMKHPKCPESMQRNAVNVMVGLQIAINIVDKKILSFSNLEEKDS